MAKKGRNSSQRRKPEFKTTRTHEGDILVQEKYFGHTLRDLVTNRSLDVKPPIIATKEDRDRWATWRQRYNSILSQRPHIARF